MGCRTRYVSARLRAQTRAVLRPSTRNWEIPLWHMDILTIHTRWNWAHRFWSDRFVCSIFFSVYFLPCIFLFGVCCGMGIKIGQFCSEFGNGRAELGQLRMNIESEFC